MELAEVNRFFVCLFAVFSINKLRILLKNASKRPFYGASLIYVLNTNKGNATYFRQKRTFIERRMKTPACMVVLFQSFTQRIFRVQKLPLNLYNQLTNADCYNHFLSKMPTYGVYTVVEIDIQTENTLVRYLKFHLQREKLPKLDSVQHRYDHSKLKIICHSF